MIEIKHLNKSFKDKVVLEDLSLTINRGSIFGLIGINGAGKSTLLRLLSGIYKSDSGTILINGKPVYENKRVKRDIFFLAEDPYYAIQTTGIELKNLYDYYYGLDQNLLDEYLELFNINLKMPIQQLSKGQRRQVFICFALASRPKYLFLDEVFDGLDPISRLSFKKALIKLVDEENSTVIISSHSLRELEDICDAYGLIDQQHILKSGKIDEDLDHLHTFQLAFDEPKTEADFKELNMVRFEQTGRVYQIIVRGHKKEIEETLMRLKPILIDHLPTTFEDLFILEASKKGYIK